MIQTFDIPRKALPRTIECIASLVPGVPVYRTLRGLSLDEYSRCGIMTPKDGDLYSVGNGVFFYLNPKNVSGESGSIVVVSSLERLTRGRKLIDTRISGYEKCAETENLSPYSMWAKILENDTITLIPGDVPVYSRRTPISRNELFFEIKIMD